ncbi:MAG: hypothetical protein K5858_11420, partial [Lachnospiraceae bacterium]|nr:hypothetical protein [Lachnospiraceae bacterium]
MNRYWGKIVNVDDVACFLGGLNVKKRGFILAISVIACLSAVFFIFKGIKRPEIPVKQNKTSITVHIDPQIVSGVRYHF